MKPTIALMSALTLGSLATAAAPAPVAFAWFEYAGHDTVFEAPLPAGHFRNPILAGFYPDPAICRVGDDFYLVNSTFAYFPGIPIFHSRDLVNWRQIGNVIDRPTQLAYDGLGVSRGIFAPTLSHHNGTFYLLCTMVDAGGNFLVTATDPAGPWSDPVWLGFDGIDPSLFFDDTTGRAWLVNNGEPPDHKPLYQGHRAIWIQEFDAAARKLVGPRQIIINGGVDLSKKPSWIEGPHLFRRGGWYYLCCAEGGTSLQHSQVIFRSASPTGPFVPWTENPILTQRDLDGDAPHAVTCTGHADLVEGPDGNWWSVFLACRPYARGFQTTGRETFLLPVRWTEDGWPQILPPGVRVPYVVASPAGTTLAPSEMPFSGNFTARDEFDGAKLALSWLSLRTSPEPRWTVAGGALQLMPSADALSGKGRPAFVARRIQHARFEASAALTPPAAPGVAAGIAAFQNETHHDFLGVRRTAAGLEVFLERLNGNAPEIVARKPIADAPTLALRIAGHDDTMSFAFRAGGGAWQTLVADAPTGPITVQAAGGGLHFTGAVVGPHARLER